MSANIKNFQLVLANSTRQMADDLTIPCTGSCTYSVLLKQISFFMHNNCKKTKKEQKYIRFISYLFIFSITLLARHQNIRMLMLTMHQHLDDEKAISTRSE